jgi:hypothetical protein
MPGGKNNTQRIETLESLTGNLSSRLDVLQKWIEGIENLLNKYIAATEGHGSKIILVEERILILGDLKEALKAIAPLEKELVAVKKDLEALQKWKEDQKREAEERTKWYRSFGPTIVGVILSGITSALVAYFVAKR